MYVKDGQAIGIGADSKAVSIAPDWQATRLTSGICANTLK